MTSVHRSRAAHSLVTPIDGAVLCLKAPTHKLCVSPGRDDQNTLNLRMVLRHAMEDEKLSTRALPGWAIIPPYSLPRDIRFHLLTPPLCDILLEQAAGDIQL